MSGNRILIDFLTYSVLPVIACITDWFMSYYIRWELKKMKWMLLYFLRVWQHTILLNL